MDHARLRAACPRERLGGAAPWPAADVMLIAIEPMGYGVQLAFSDGYARGM